MPCATTITYSSVGVGESAQQQQRRVADREAERAHRPDPLAPDPVREMAERDLAGDAGQADEAERPRRVGRREADLDQVLGLVHLHRVPGEEAAEVAERDPPEARGAHGAAERPVDRGPRRVDDVRRARRGGAARATRSPSGSSPMSSGRRRSSRLSGDQHEQHEQAHGQQAVRQPARPIRRLQPRQQDDRADADAGERDAHRQAAPAHEPVGQEERLAGVAEADAAAADQHAERRVEVPRPA